MADGGYSVGAWDAGRIAARYQALPDQEMGGLALVRAMIEDAFPGRIALVSSFGAEAAVLTGARETIGRHRPALFVECNRPEGSPALIEAIEGLGYAAWWHIAAYFNPDNFFRNGENVFARFVPEANLLCLPSDAEARLEGLIPVEGTDDTWRKAVKRAGEDRP